MRRCWVFSLPVLVGVFLTMGAAPPVSGGEQAQSCVTVSEHIGARGEHLRLEECGYGAMRAALDRAAPGDRVELIETDRGNILGEAVVAGGEDSAVTPLWTNSEWPDGFQACALTFAGQGMCARDDGHSWDWNTSDED